VRTAVRPNRRLVVRIVVLVAMALSLVLAVRHHRTIVESVGGDVVVALERAA